MSTHDPRRGSEVADLARLLPVPAERDLPNGRQHLLKEHLMTEFRNDQRAGQATAPRRPRRPRLPRLPRRRAGLATAAGAAALAAAVTAGGLWALDGPGAAQHGATHLTAAHLLAKVASAAARATPADVTDSQFAYIESQVSFGTNNGPAPEQTHQRQVWIPVADLCAGGLLVEHGKRTSLKAPLVATIINGKKKFFREKCPDEGALNDPTYRLFQSLPADPRALLDRIKHETQGAGQSPDQEAFTTIGDMLRESIAPPEVSAALYRAAALIPGVTVVPDVADATGRPGVAVSFTFRGVQEEWIFDPHTFEFLGERDFLHGVLDGKAAVITRAFVDHAGDLP